MKIFILLINFYLLVLSCIVCGDRDKCMDDTQQQTTIAIKQPHPSTAPEVCTPFCICAHCPASAFFEQAKIGDIIPNVFFATTYPIQEISFSPILAFTIWQPPKIG